jgi:hypothetical protein
MQITSEHVAVKHIISHQRNENQIYNIHSQNEMDLNRNQQ